MWTQKLIIIKEVKFVPSELILSLVYLESIDAKQWFKFEFCFHIHMIFIYTFTKICTIERNQKKEIAPEKAIPDHALKMPDNNSNNVELNNSYEFLIILDYELNNNLSRVEE